jgi:hypothetical protein
MRDLPASVGARGGTLFSTADRSGSAGFTSESVAFVSADVDVRGTAPGMFATP